MRATRLDHNVKANIHWNYNILYCIFKVGNILLMMLNMKQKYTSERNSRINNSVKWEVIDSRQLESSALWNTIFFYI